ncbi:Aste57867_11178 [Aphanomyces stellatus]|uniref:Aste57867_11178 protein n=1 Tax=Aphanomyces stellatus TaxID=120398 RepID=A0A485KS70_9STRA|nr:hypothetical protein As57867_011136 [Aphanomyces stellatus]VFT88045.1 Aste57867_11178 [Aphanomyces stellatus]
MRVIVVTISLIVGIAIAPTSNDSSIVSTSTAPVTSQTTIHPTPRPPLMVDGDLLPSPPCVENLVGPSWMLQLLLITTAAAIAIVTCVGVALFRVKRQAWEQPPSDDEDVYIMADRRMTLVLM